MLLALFSATIRVYFVCFQVEHGRDYRLKAVTGQVSEGLTHGSDYCFAKSHLLAALLCANGIPAGLGYQARWR